MKGIRKGGVLAAAGFLATIVAANYAVHRFGMTPVGLGLLAPAGVYFAGLAFTLRDVTQEQLGKAATVLVVLAGAGLSFAVGAGQVAVAGSVAFLVSELADLAVYTPLRSKGYVRAVIASNVVGLAVDSALFLWLAFGSLQFLAGQIVGKAWVTALAVALIVAWRRRAARA